MKRRRILTGGIGAIVVGGLLLTGCGSGGDPAVQAQSSGVIDLSGVRPNWDKALPAASRFVVLAAFTNDAVRDNNTGLVWEQFPQAVTATWSAARFTCVNKTVGGQKGWRLPSFPELASLVDPSVSPGPTLPAGHPFTGVLSASYWAATSDAENPEPHAWLVNFGNGFVGAANKANDFRGWCVRGGMNADQY